MRRAALSLYATLKPRIEEAYRELGYPDASFDAALERAIVSLLETPVRSRPTRLRLQGIGYAFADPHDEALTGAQKQLLRMDRKNGLSRSGEAARDRPRARNTAAAFTAISEGWRRNRRLGQDGIFALNFLVRAASVVNHLISRSAPVRNRSIHAGGRTEKSILWRPQSGRRPS